MSGSGTLADRLRANLAAARIPAPPADIDRVLADGRMERAERWIDRIRRRGGEDLPDFLGHRLAPPPDGTRAGVGASAGGAAAPPDTIAGVAPRVRAGDVSPVELTDAALRRIEDRDPRLNAFQSVLADHAMSAARRAESEIAAGEYRGPLHGIPVAVKDLLDMRGTLTTSGSTVGGDASPDLDAGAVERLESAGAVVVGKTRLPEFAFLPGSANPHYGPTANPRDETRDAGGSSSGSAAAVGDGMAFAAIGTDTGGSIRIPAALCGVVGLKPTFGRTSLFGCTPLAWSLDHLGPLARSVEDVAILLAALAGEDHRDPRTRPGTDFVPPTDLDRGAEGLRVAVPSSDGSVRPLGSVSVLRAWEESSRALESAGAEVVEVELDVLTTLRAASSVILSIEAAALHEASLRARYQEYGEPCRDRLLSGFAFGAVDLLQSQRCRTEARRELQALLERVDVISTPAQPAGAPPLGMAASVRFTNGFNALGWPAVTVPFGLDEHGLPLATQLVGRPWDEATVLRAAHTLEATA